MSEENSMTGVVPNEWVEELYEELEAMKYPAVVEDMEIPEDSDNPDYTYMKAGYNKGVYDAIQKLADMFHERTKEEIRQVERKIEEVEERDLSEEQMEEIQSLKDKVQQNRKKMEIIEEARELAEELQRGSYLEGMH